MKKKTHHTTSRKQLYYKNLDNVTKLNRTPLPPRDGYFEQTETIEKSGWRSC